MLINCSANRALQNDICLDAVTEGLPLSLSHPACIKIKSTVPTIRVPWIADGVEDNKHTLEHLIAISAAGEGYYFLDCAQIAVKIP